MTDRDYDSGPSEDVDFEELDGVYRPRLADELTLRDLFAAVALHGLTSKYGSYNGMAEEASKIADEMMRSRP